MTVPSFGPHMVCTRCGMIGPMSGLIGWNAGHSATPVHDGELRAAAGAAGESRLNDGQPGVAAIDRRLCLRKTEFTPPSVNSTLGSALIEWQPDRGQSRARIWTLDTPGPGSARSEAITVADVLTAPM